MTNYDANKDNTLDENEVQRLWNDIQSYDYAGIVAADVAQTKAWIAKFDTSNDGKITVAELVKALEAEAAAGPLSLAKWWPFKSSFSKPAYTKPVYTKPVVTKPVVKKPVIVKPVVVKPKKPSKKFKFSHGIEKNFDEEDIREYAKWILDNYDINMDGFLNNSEMTQVEADYPNLFFDHKINDYKYSYNEILSVIRGSYPVTSLNANGYRN